MKINNTDLKNLIKEELLNLLNEAGFGEGTPPKGEFYEKQVVTLEEDSLEEQ